MTFRGAIFDVDGVLVDSPHEPAWRDSLRELMEGDWSDIVGDTSWTPAGFTSQIYQQVLSGKPRMDGARDALEHFGVPGVEKRAQVYADRKQAKVVALIEAGKFKAYPDAVRFVLAVEAAGIPTAAASSSKNAGMLLSKIQLDEFGRPGEVLLDVFDADVSGRNFAHGKPAPDIFLAAAEELGASPGACFVVEDAPNGIQAAKAGGMAGLGVARTDDADLLAEKHADLVVTSLDKVLIADLSKARLTES